MKTISIALTLLTTFTFSVSSFALNRNYFDAAVNQNDSRLLLACVPLFVGVLTIQAVHELAHFVVARVRKIKIGKPTPIPSPQLGTFGCITPLLSFPKDRAAWFFDNIFVADVCWGSGKHPCL